MPGTKVAHRMTAQFNFLNALRRERRLVVVYLLGGTRLQGRITSFDQQALLLETKTGMVMCSQDQISTVGLDLPKSMSRARSSSAGPQRATLAHGTAPNPRGRPEPDGNVVIDPRLERGRDKRESDEPIPSPDPLGSAAPTPEAPIVTQKPRRKIVLPVEHSGSRA